MVFFKANKKISSDQLDKLFNDFNQEVKTSQTTLKRSLTIIFRDQLYIKQNNIPKILITFLRDNLNFINSDYLIKKRIGISVYRLEKYFKLIKSVDGNIAIPRGFLHDLTDFLNKKNIKFEIVDERNKLEEIKVESRLQLHDYQKEAIESIAMSENGILVAPPGSGKTIIGIDLITKIKQPTLILVHKKLIFNQWVERIENFLNIPKREIGQLASNKKKINDKITVAMVQTLNRMDDLKTLSDKYGMIIVDECHHMPAKMFRNVITRFNPFYLYGLTATPERKNNDAKLIFIYLGPILHTIERDFYKIKPDNKKVSENIEHSPKVLIQNTDLFVPFMVKTDNFQILSKIITFDSNRNMKIVADIKRKIKEGLKCLVLTERKEHVEVLAYYLKRDTEIIIMTGDLTANQRKIRVKQIELGNFHVLLATGQLVGEGTDFPGIDCLFLVYPFAFSGKLTQYIGRIQRDINSKKFIYDYRDINVEFLEKLFKKRLRYYKKYFGIYY